MAAAGSWRTEFFGGELLTKGEGDAVARKSTEEALSGKKFVIVYFSALFCAPCRKFSPLLAVCYEDREDANEVEVVFCSNDMDIDSFDEYYEEMPWLAVPYDQEDIRAKLGERLGASHLPTVVVLDGATGAIVNPDARALITAKKTLNGTFSS